MPQSLPAPLPEAEDAYIAAWRDGDDIDGLVEAITQAMADRRPQLAARMVGLLEGRVEIQPGTPLHRAQTAARLLLVAPTEVASPLFEDLDQAWSLARAAQIRRITARMSDRAAEISQGLFDVPNHQRRPRLTGHRRRG